MLVLTRKVGERIVVDDQIIITIVEVKGDNIRVAIDAPKAIKIYRGEIYDAIVAENQRAVVPLDIPKMEMLKTLHITK